MQNKTKNSIRFFGFTLVEMLIVVVIIGILSSVLLPRITGYMARTRDLKRQMDLKNLATAVEMYKSYKGKLPLLGDENGPYKSINCFYAGAAEGLAFELKDYLAEIPTNPSSNMIPKYHIINVERGQHRNIFGGIDNNNYYCLFRAGQYFYQTMCSTHLCQEPDLALLITQMETPDFANFIALEIGETSRNFCTTGKPWQKLGSPRWRVEHDKVDRKKSYPTYTHARCRKLCTSVTKGSVAEMKETAQGVECTYTDPKQLYYIHPIY